LNNAAKHARAEELFLRICRQEQKLIVTIEDNGIGFDPVVLRQERNGLLNMQQRMAEIGGHCDIVSQPGLGCRITFSVPLKPAESRLGFGWLRRNLRVSEPHPETTHLQLPPDLAEVSKDNA
jgi:signal transduction histidine kinase